jgi:hypothetical protein
MMTIIAFATEVGRRVAAASERSRQQTIRT